MMPIIALSVTEAELFAAVMCVQDMLFIIRVLLSIYGTEGPTPYYVARN
jgi:hypothetical protein